MYVYIYIVHIHTSFLDGSTRMRPLNRSSFKTLEEKVAQAHQSKTPALISVLISNHFLPRRNNPDLRLVQHLFNAKIAFFCGYTPL